MSDEGEIVRWVVARVRAIRVSDWRTRAGQRFREMMDRLSKFSEEHDIRAQDLADEGVKLGRRALHGKANKDLAAAVKDYAEAEQKKIETELKKKSLESQLRKEEAEARLSELKVLDAELELLKKLQEAGVMIRRDTEGNLTVLPAVRGCDLEDLAKHRLLAAPSDPNSKD